METDLSEQLQLYNSFCNQDFCPFCKDSYYSDNIACKTHKYSLTKYPKDNLVEERYDFMFKSNHIAPIKSIGKFKPVFKCEEGKLINKISQHSCESSIWAMFKGSHNINVQLFKFDFYIPISKRHHYVQKIINYKILE